MPEKILVAAGLKEIKIQEVEGKEGGNGIELGPAVRAQFYTPTVVLSKRNERRRCVFGLHGG